MSVHALPDRDAPTFRVAREIRAMMARSEVSQTRMAHVLGLSQTAISKRLRGVTPFDINELSIIAAFFRTPLAELIRESERPKPEGPEPRGLGATGRGEECAARESNPQPAGLVLALVRGMSSNRLGNVSRNEGVTKPSSGKRSLALVS